jgi:hypothetical protein
MRRKLLGMVAAAVLVGTLGVGSAPAGAAEPRATVIDPGGFVLSLDGSILGTPRVLNLAAAVHAVYPDQPEILWPHLGGVPVEFWSGPYRLCTAVTSTSTANLGKPDYGIATCNLPIATPGGLNVLLTGDVEARFPGNASYLPSSAKAPKVGWYPQRLFIF